MANLTVSPEHLQLFELGGALVLFVIVLLAWIIPHERAALTFTEAEVAFLFPAPVTRRTLIHFKLLRSQLRIFFSVLLLTLCFPAVRRQCLDSRLRLVADSFDAEPSLPGLFVCPDDVAGSRHFQPAPAAAGFRAGRGDGRWRLDLGKTNPAGPGSRRHRQSRCDAGLRAAGLDHRPGACICCYPFRLMVRPFLAPDATAFFSALPPVLLLFLLHYLWVIYSDVAFEEASVEASQKLATRIAAVRAGNWQGAKKNQKARRPWFKLTATGPVRHGVVLEKSHRRRPGLFRSPLDFHRHRRGRFRLQLAGNAHSHGIFPCVVALL